MPASERRLPREAGDTPARGAPHARLAPPRRRARASVAEERRRRGLIAGHVGGDRSAVGARNRDLPDLSPFALAWLAGGAFLGAIAIAALGSRLAGDALVLSLTPLVGGDKVRGFAAGFVSGLPPTAVIWWLLSGRRRDDPARGPKTLGGCLLLLLVVIPWLVLAPPRRPRTQGVSAQNRSVALHLPGAQAGAVTVLIGAGALLGGVSLSATARRHAGPRT